MEAFNSGDFSKYFDKLRADLRSDVEQIVKSEISRLREDQAAQLNVLKNENEVLKLALEQQKEVISSMNRVNNIVFFNIPEEDKEDRDSLINKILDICSKTMSVPIEKSQVNWVKRLGKSRNGVMRPVLVAFVSNILKWDILKKSAKLKGSKISITEDFDKKVRDERKYVADIRKQCIKDGKQCKWKKNGLEINGKFVSFEQLKAGSVGIRSPQLSGEETEVSSRVPNQDMESARKRKRQESSRADPVKRNLDQYFRPVTAVPEKTAISGASNQEC